MLEQIKQQLSQCRKLEFMLLGDLRDVLHEEPNVQTRNWLLLIVDELLRRLPEEYDLCTRYGYLNHVLREFPEWEALVDRLENQYLALYKRLLLSQEHLQSGQDFSVLAGSLRLELRSWIGAFTVLHRHEARLQKIASLSTQFLEPCLEAVQ